MGLIHEPRTHYLAVGLRERSGVSPHSQGYMGDGEGGRGRGRA